MSGETSTSLRYGDNPPKLSTSVSQRVAQPSDNTMTAGRVHAYMVTKSDGGDLAAGLAYQTSSPEARNAARLASLDKVVQEAMALISRG